jgi:AAA15 family ATPase/GTPase
MFISSFRLFNYKSYLDSEELALTPGINIVVGQNDAGKSALLEGLGLHFENKPHHMSIPDYYETCGEVVFTGYFEPVEVSEVKGRASKP